MLLLLALLSLLLAGSRAWYRLEVERQATVQEGLCVLVPCSFSYPEDTWSSEPIYSYWFREGTNTDKGQPVATNNQNRDVLLSTQGRFQLVGNPLQKSCTLLIRDARQEDQGSYFFRVEKGKVKYSFNYYKLRLQVTELTQKPDVFVPEPLEPGRPVTVFCLFGWNSELCPAPVFSWEGPALASEGTGPPGAPYSTLSLTPGPRDQGTELTCRVTFSGSGRSTERTVRLTVAYAPKISVIRVSHDNTSAQDIHDNGTRVEARRGQRLRLLCGADSRPPATLSWELEGRVLARSPPSGPGSLGLELPGLEPGDTGHYTCRAENGLGAQQRGLDLHVQYAPWDLRVTASQANGTVLEIHGNGTTLPVLEGQSLRLVCATHSSPPARLSWARGMQPLSPPWALAPGVLELARVQTEHEGEVTCHAENPLGASSVSLNLSVHYAPTVLGPSCSREPPGLRCSCSSHARPAPALHWRLGEARLEGNLSDASLAVTSSAAGPWANSSLSLSGEPSSGLRLSCEARNAHGAHCALVLLSPDKAPAFSEGVLLGVGGTALLSLCVVLVLWKLLRTPRTQGASLRPKFSRSSTILDYINVIPKPGPLARNRKAELSSPPQTSAPEAHSPVPTKNQKEQRSVSLGLPEPQTLTGTPDPEVCSERLHYATVSFPGLRQWETQQPTGSQEDYAEIKFY